MQTQTTKWAAFQIVLSQHFNFSLIELNEVRRLEAAEVCAGDAQTAIILVGQASAIIAPPSIELTRWVDGVWSPPPFACPTAGGQPFTGTRLCDWNIDN